jgi:ankyrin repeat protein
MEVVLPQLSERPNLEHLKKQAKDLLRLYQANDTGAFARFRNSLPSAGAKADGEIAAMRLRLHDAQSCVAREYGFSSWGELKDFVEWKNAQIEDRANKIRRWLFFVYGGHENRPRPELAARLLADEPNFIQGDLYLACAVGDRAELLQSTTSNPEWVNRKGGPLGMPPLVALTHSGLGLLPTFRDRIRECVRLLLESGADPNQSWVEQTGSALSALYGAAGRIHDPEMTRLLLEAGANPNDGESLYHSIESPDLACTRLLLGAGARMEGPILCKMLDFDRIDGLRFLLSRGASPNEGSSALGLPLIHAIKRRRSTAHVELLLEQGADPRVKTQDGVSAYRLALRLGLPEVAELLRRSGAVEPLSEEEQFVAACACGDRPEALRIRVKRPDLPASLNNDQLRLLPDLASEGCHDAVKLMVELGWPIAARGGDWDASALNLAVFRGDSGLVRYLLEHGSSWTERHGHDDNVCGTLSWASRNEPVERREGLGDWVGCARALVDHGMPVPDSECHFGASPFSDEVAEFFAELSNKR